MSTTVSRREYREGCAENKHAEVYYRIPLDTGEPISIGINIYPFESKDKDGRRKIAIVSQEHFRINPVPFAHLLDALYAVSRQLPSRPLVGEAGVMTVNTLVLGLLAVWEYAVNGKVDSDDFRELFDDSGPLLSVSDIMTAANALNEGSWTIYIDKREEE